MILSISKAGMGMETLNVVGRQKIVARKTMVILLIMTLPIVLRDQSVSQVLLFGSFILVEKMIIYFHE